MPLVYITGVPGSGKLTVREAFLRRGQTALGGVEDKVAAFYNNTTGKRIDWMPIDKRTPEWSAEHTWKIARVTIEKLKASAGGDLIFVCATTANDTTELWDLFDEVIALIIDEATLRHRLATRTNNDVGKSPSELAAIVKRQQTAQQMYQEFGTVIVDSTQPIDAVVDEIIASIRR